MHRVRSARDGIVLKYHFKEDWDETQNSPIDCIASSRLKLIVKLRSNDIALDTIACFGIGNLLPLLPFWKRLNFNIYLDPEVSNQNLKCKSSLYMQTIDC